MKTVKGIIMTLDHPNKNGRIYSSEMMEKEIEKFNQRIENGELLGMISSSNGIYERCNLQNSSHRLRSISVSGNNPKVVEGEFDIMDTPNGKWLQSYMSDNQIGCEVVGNGVINPETYEVEKFSLERIDILPKENCAWDESVLKEV